VILFTDGLVETRGESIDERLDHLLRSARGGRGGPPGELLDHLIASMLEGEAAADDVALLAVEVDALDAAHVSLQFPAVPTALPRLRHTLRRWLEQAGIAPTEVFEITVAVSEAFNNAVEHAYGASDAVVEVDARLTDGDLRVQVQDWGQWRAPRGTHRGRGLGLMRGLMDDVDVTPGETGTLVSLRRRLRREVPV
jgi:anti-sigma regulatory factor (Ser/Thr protein kinase)